MKNIQGLNTDAEQSGLSNSLVQQINLLGNLLGKVLDKHAGPEVLEIMQTLRQYFINADKFDKEHFREKAEQLMRDQSLDQLIWLLRAYIAFFHLLNKAEQNEISRINLERAWQATAQSPRSESIADAILQLKQKGLSLSQVLVHLNRIDIQPTLTAHPTEARRRSVLFKLQKMSALIKELRSQSIPPEDQEEIVQELYQQITLMLMTDEVRTERLTVRDEVENGMYFCSTSIWEMTPHIYEDLAAALSKYYGYQGELPVILRFRSWIGGDRDGNPNVTSQITWQTLQMHFRIALDRYLQELRILRRELSLTTRQSKIPQELLDSIHKDEEELVLDSVRKRQYQHEPYRVKISYIMQRLTKLLNDATNNQINTTKAFAYTSMSFIADLKLIRQCLLTSGLDEIAYSRQLSRLILQAETFGFHVAALDIRQHSEIHENAVSELLNYANVHTDYLSLTENQRLELLTEELKNPRPLVPKDTPLSATTQETLQTLTSMNNIMRSEPQSLGLYIISMTHDVSDMLEVLILAKEVGLWRWHKGEVQTSLDVVPLFETIDDLERSEKLMEELFTHPIYKLHLEARKQFQEIMLGYSDSNKDGGFWMANWALHKAQNRLAQICNQYQIDFRLFHGRGGTVGRGGGRANQAILAMPPRSNNGRIRFTEQGEVISFRYAFHEIARRHLEQIVNAVILASADFNQALKPQSGHYFLTPEQLTLMEKLAQYTMSAYRLLIEDPLFWSWYIHITPIEHISKLPIASRPVSRKSAQEVDFSSLRAIPWGFSWNQTRYNIPGWYGIGEAFRRICEENPENVNTLQQFCRQWPFFQTLLANANLEMARVRLNIAKYYSQFGKGDFHDKITKDFELATQYLKLFTGKETFLNPNSALSRTITLRNPFTDILNFLQIELMQRWEKVEEVERENLRRALFLSINGISAAMQSTG